MRYAFALVFAAGLVVLHIIATAPDRPASVIRRADTVPIAVGAGPARMPPQDTSCSRPRLDHLIARQDRVVVWSNEAIFVTRPGADELRRVPDVDQIRAVAVVSGEVLALMGDPAELHLVADTGVVDRRVVPLTPIDAIAASGQWLIAFGEGGVAVSSDVGRSWRTSVLQQVWPGASVRVRGGWLEILDVWSMSCVGSWTVPRFARIGAIGGDGVFVERAFPGDVQEPWEAAPGDMAFMHWEFAHDGWLVAADDTSIHWLRNLQRHREVSVGPGAEGWDVEIAHGGARTWAIHHRRLLRITPSSSAVIDGSLPEELMHLAVDDRGRPLAIDGARVVRWSDAAGWSALPMECAPP